MGEKGEEKKGGAKKKNKVKTVDLPIDSMVPQLNKDKLNLLIEKEVLAAFVAGFLWLEYLSLALVIKGPAWNCQMTLILTFFFLPFLSSPGSWWYDDLGSFESA